MVTLTSSEISRDEEFDKYVKKLTDAVGRLVDAYRVLVEHPLPTPYGKAFMDSIKLDNVRVVRAVTVVPYYFGTDRYVVWMPQAFVVDRVDAWRCLEQEPKYELAFFSGRDTVLSLVVPPETIPDAINFIANVDVVNAINRLIGEKDPILASTIDTVTDITRRIVEVKLPAGTNSSKHSVSYVPPKLDVELDNNVFKKVRIVPGYRYQQKSGLYLLERYSVLLELDLQVREKHNKLSYYLSDHRESAYARSLMITLMLLNKKREVDGFVNEANTILEAFVTGKALIDAWKKLTEGG